MEITELEMEKIRFHLDCVNRVFGKVAKRQNAKNSSDKRKENGTKAGRKRTFNYSDIRKLRDKGMSYRAVAKEIGCSTTAVQRAMRD